MKRRERAADVLPVSFFSRSPEVVARELVGAIIVSDIGGVRSSGRIVETEAYLGRDDPASHGYQLRRTVRNEALFGPPGQWYVYLSYGIHWCANLVCWSEGMGSAVLLRALEPVEGIEVMRKRRSVSDDRLLCSGPGKLCQALGMTRAHDGVMMAKSPVRVLAGSADGDHSIAVTPRIGITKAAEWPLRFAVAGSRWVSGGRNGGTAVRR
jgi:DNA-3-methyladenine glycosylase